MQISAIKLSNTSFKGMSNSEKIHQLEQKRVENQWASEGCTGGLSAADEFELSLRKELRALEQKHAQVQSATEGCNCGLCAEEYNRMSEIRNILKSFEQETTQEEPKYTSSIYNVPSGNIYGVPDSTFWGDWAR